MPKPVIESAAASAHQAGELLVLQLDQIILDPVTDVRIASDRQKEEGELIDDLARTMYTQGQHQPVLVRPNGHEGKYLLIAGRRRYAAAQLIEGKTKEQFPLKAVLTEKTDHEAWVAAVAENVQRKQFSPIEFARICVQVKERGNFKSADWTAHVAEYLSVSRATVSQHVKLLKLPKAIQEKVDRGILSAGSALDLAQIKDADQQQAVFERAQEKAEAEKSAKKTAAGQAGGSQWGSQTSSEPSEMESAPQSASKSRKAQSDTEAESEPEKGAIKRKHIVAAAREVEAIVKPRTRHEIVAFFDEIVASTDAYAKPLMDFADFFVNKWATGEGSDRQLRNRLNTISECCETKKPKRKA